MSAHKKPAKGDEKTEKKGKSKKKLVVVVAALGVAAGGGYMMLAPAEAGPPKPGAVVPLDPTTVNLTDGHYLKVAVAIELVEGKGTAEEFKSSKAAELVINEFSDRSVKSLSTNAARVSLVKELQHKIKEAYEGEVYAIYLTQFVTQ